MGGERRVDPTGRWQWRPWRERAVVGRQEARGPTAPVWAVRWPGGLFTVALPPHRPPE